MKPHRKVELLDLYHDLCFTDFEGFLAEQPEVVVVCVDGALQEPLYRLKAHLDTFPKVWLFPRGDLHHWIPALNRFDDILALFIKEYDLSSGPQTIPFSNNLLLRGMGKGSIGEGPGDGTTPEVLESTNIPSDGDRVLVEKIVDFTRILFENCSNRSLYSSSDRLNDLLNTTSLSLLESTLRLGQRLSQRYLAARLRHGPAPYLSHVKQDTLASHYQLDLNRVETIAMPFLKSSSTIQGDHPQKADTSNAGKESTVHDLLSMIRSDGTEDQQWEEISTDMLQKTSVLPLSSSTGNPNSAADKDVLPASSDILGESSSSERQTDSTELPISLQELKETSILDILREIVPKFSSSNQYQCLHRARIAKAFLGDLETRRQIVGINLLAIANLLNIYPEQMLQQTIMAQEMKESRRYQLAYQLCDLIHPPGDGATEVPKKLQNFALLCLEGFTNHKTKSTEVCAALNVNVNHGVLAYVVRKAVAELSVQNKSQQDLIIDTAWRDALFALLYALPKCSSRAAEGFASAGLLDLFVEALKSRSFKAEVDHCRVLNFLDVIVYNSRESFNSLVNAKGLDAISELLSFAVDESALRVEKGRGLQKGFFSQITDYKIPWVHHQTLRALFKFVTHMMQMNGGPFDRLLRNLIESSQLLASLRTIIADPKMFGSTVWSGTVGVISLFIHNEPTSYAAIAEAGITKTFLETITQKSIPVQDADNTSDESGRDAIEGFAEGATLGGKESTSQPQTWKEVIDQLSKGILPASEAITAISEAFSAICLNDAGMQQVESSHALRYFFRIFLCPPHVKALLNSTNKEIEKLGATFDELARHYPRLKPEILKIIAKMAAALSRMAHNRASKQFIGPKLWVRDDQGQEVVDGGRQALQADPASSMERNGDSDVEMRDVQITGPRPSSHDVVSVQDVTSNEPPPSFPAMAEYISVFSKFLMGFFSNPSLVQPFSETEGIERLLDIVTATSLPFDYSDQHPSANLVSVIQILVENKPHLTLPSLITRAQNSLDNLEPFLNYTEKSSFFQSFVQASDREDSAASNESRNFGTSVIKALSVTQTLCVILSRSHTPTSTRNGTNSLSSVNLADMYARLIDSLGKLLSKCAWESALMKENVPELYKNPRLYLPSGSNANAASAGLAVDIAENSSEANSNEFGSNENDASAVARNGTTEGNKSIEEKNFVQVKYFMNRLPTIIAQLLHAIGKYVIPRRITADSYQKQCLVMITDHIAQALINPLSSVFPTDVNARSVECFYSIVVSIITQTMIDNRAEPMDRPGPQVLTLTLRSFKNKDGLAILGRIFKFLFDASVDIQNQIEGNEDTRDCEAYIVDGMRSILEFFTQISNHKVVLDALQTSAIASRSERERDRADYFNQYQFLVEIRMAIMRSIQPLWQSDMLESSKPGVVRRVTQVIRNVLEAQGENGAFKRSDNIPPKSRAEHKKWRPPNTETINTMLEKGYKSDLVREALYRCYGNREAALEYCAAYHRDSSRQRHPIPSYDETSTTPTGNGQATPSISQSNAEGSAIIDELGPPRFAGASEDLQRLLGSVLVHESLPEELRGLDYPQEAGSTTENNEFQPEMNGTKAAELPDVLTVDDLEEMRSELRHDIVDRCLTILNAFDSLTFDLASLIVSAVAKASDQKSIREDVSATLVQSLISYQGIGTLQENSKKIAATAHLLGIILQDNAFFEAAKDELKDSFNSLLKFLIVPSGSASEDSSAWIAQVMLVIERILAEDAQPNQVKWDVDHQQESQGPAEVEEALVPLEDKTALFDHIIELLPHVGKNAALGLAIARILVIVTKNRSVATRLGQKKNMQRLFLMAKQMTSVMDDKFRSAFMTVLRHVIEDEDTIRQLMKSEIRSFFEKQTRAIEIPTFLRQMASLVLRQPEIFVESVNDLLELQRFDRAQSTNLRLKREQPSETPGEPVRAQNPEDTEGMQDLENAQTATTNESVADKSKSSEPRTPVVENPDGVIHYLLSELLSYKDVEDTEPRHQTSQLETNLGDVDMTSEEMRTTQNNNQPQNNRETENKQQFKLEDHPIFAYKCFILQSLTELLQSYNRTKLEFIYFSRKADPQAATPTKPRSGVLNYILNGLIPTGSVEHASDIASKKTSALSNWAICVIVALCARTSEKSSRSGRDTMDENDDPDLVSVRRFVLEHALKAFKDANSSTDPFPAKYSKILAFADMFDRMLTGNKSGDPAYHRRHESHGNDEHAAPNQKQLAKIMFEKNFIAALTNSMADIDLAAVGSQRVVKYILRPLKLLTHTAIELSLSPEYSTSAGQTDDDEISSATSLSDAMEGREETPDLFRNSTLGMFEPGRQDESSSSSEGEDDEDAMYEDDYADDMEFDEAGGEDEEVLSDEEDVDMDGPMEGLPGEVGMEVEIDLSGDQGDSDDDEESEDEDDEDDESMDDSEPDHDEDADDEIEIMDEDVHPDEDESLPDDEEGEWQDDDVDDGIQYEDVDDPDLALDMAAAGERLNLPMSGEDSQSEDVGMDYHDPDIEEEPVDDEEMAIEVEHDGPIHEDSEPDEDEEEDDYDDEEIIYGDREFEEDETDMPPFIFGWPPTPNRRPHGRHHWAGLPRPERWMVPPGYRSHRPQGGIMRGNEDGMNPLLNRGLQQSGGDPFQGRTTLPTGDRYLGRLAAADAPFPSFSRNIGNRLAQALAGLGGNHMATINEIMNFLGPPMPAFAGGPGMPQHMGHHHHHHHHHPPGGALHFTIPFGGQLPRGLEDIIQIGSPHSVHVTRSDRHDPAQSVSFTPGFTMGRWQEESRLIFGSTISERCLRVHNAILRLLVPPAQEAERIRKAKAAEKAKQEELERARIQQEREEREKRELEEREARKAAEREAAAAAEAERQAALAEEGGQEAATNQDGDAMEGVESNVEPSQDQNTEAQPAEPRPRVIASLRGQEIDITDLGIDNAYLEALPEDMRTEVIMMQFAEQRSQAAASGQEPSTINSEFLDALPPDIREEVLQEEAHDRRRREREEARRRAAAEGGSVRAEEIDPASFMASLDPVLRQSVLAEADEDTLAHLPPEIAAEARALGGRHRRGPFLGVDESDALLHGRRRHDGDLSRLAAEVRGARRPIVQMLDKAAISTLLRLMFVSIHGNSRQSLNGILRNACGNHQTRGEIVSGLLSILQDGSIDLSSVERSFAQFTSRARQPGSTKASQTKRLQVDQPLAKSEVSPISVTSHCLSALVFLNQSIAHLPKFFVTEHEIVGSAKSKANRKGKGKENRANKYPINSLLSLLDRQTIVNNSTVMEQLALLLQIVTQPLTALLKKEKDEAAEKTEQTLAEPSVNAATSGDAQADNNTAHNTSTNSNDNVQNTEVAESSATAVSSTENGTTQGQEESKSSEGKASDSKKTVEPPEIPEENLRLVVNILTARDCSGKTFRDTLSAINNLSAIPSAREVFGEELVRRARELGQTIQRDLTQLIEALRGAENEMEAQSLALTNFSPAGSDQAKLNRILTALDYLFDPKSAENKSKQPEDKEQGGDDLLTSLYEDRSFAILWQQLSECLSATGQGDNYFFNVATILLPLIEALMVVCKRLSLDDSKTSKGSQSMTASPLLEAPSISNIFFTFTNHHKKILNDLVRHNPKLMSGSFSVLVKNSNVLEFDNKRNYFNRRLHHRSADQRHYPHPSLQLNVRRDQVFTDSYQALCFKKAEEIKYGKFNIRFHNEEGVDAGGVTREWFQVLSRQMFDPSYALFNPVASDRTTFHPNSLSGIHDIHLHYFKFIGRIIGKALYENRVLDCHFSRAVYKRILGKSVSIKDMESLDLEFTKSLQWMLENDITDIITETFSVEKENFGATEIIDLIENGRNIPVTDENKQEYVRLLVEYRLTGSVQEQLESFLGGFHDIVPAELIRIFDEGELELLISGMPDVDIDDWKNNTEYHNYNASSPQIQWFWRAVRSFDKEERAKLLQFVTGTGKVPLNGFKELEGMNGFTRFSIHKDYSDKDRLPSSHTCFNQLDLPEYESYEQLRKQLYTAMTTGNEFFGFA